jgi:hypothetical protein
MSIWSSYFRVRFIIMMAIGVPYAISILLEGGPRNREETATLFLVSTGILFAIGLAIAARDRRRRIAQTTLASGEPGDPGKGISRTGMFVFWAGCSTLVVAVALYVSDDVRRSGWTFPNCVGAGLGVFAVTVWGLTLRALFFPNRWRRPQQR